MKPEETHRWWPGLASRVYKMVIIAGPGGREEAEGGGKRLRVEGRSEGGGQPGSSWLFHMSQVKGPEDSEEWDNVIECHC